MVFPFGGKSVNIRRRWLICTYVSADANYCVASYGRMCKKRGSSASILASLASFFGTFPGCCRIIILFLFCGLIFSFERIRPWSFCFVKYMRVIDIIMIMFNSARIACFCPSRIPAWNIARRSGLFWQNESSCRIWQFDKWDRLCVRRVGKGENKKAKY